MEFNKSAKYNSIFNEEFFDEDTNELVLGVLEAPGVKRLLDKMRAHHPETVLHMLGVAEMTAAAILCIRPALDAEKAKNIVTAAMLHDIGKYGLPQELIAYTGIFSDDQRAQASMHTIIGPRIASTVLEPTAQLVYDTIELHHANASEVEAYISRKSYDDEEYVQDLKIAVICVAAADYVESTMQIGPENSHFYRLREGSPHELIDDVYQPLYDMLPDVYLTEENDQTYNVKDLAFAKMYQISVKRTDEYKANYALDMAA